MHKPIGQKPQEMGANAPLETAKPRSNLRAGAGQGAVHLLRYATVLRVTPPHRCGSRRWYGRKVPFRPGYRPEPPPFPRKQPSFRSARSGPGREAAKRTLDGEDRSGILAGERKRGCRNERFCNDPVPDVFSRA